MKENSKKTTGKDQNFGQIMGINVLGSSMNRVLAGVEEKITDSVKFSILTPNPELVLMAQKNRDLRTALNSADFPIPDGVGLSYASKFLTGKPLNIIPGRKVFDELIKLADEKGWKVFLLGGLDDEAGLAKLKIENLLKNENWKLKIETDRGPKLNDNGEPASIIDIKLQQDAVDKINKFAPDLLFVAFGNPKQELWVLKNLRKLNIHGIMAVGGTFRYIAGLSPLPPKWMAESGLEWLWRIFTEPKRILRILNAAVVFPWKVFMYKLRH